MIDRESTFAEPKIVQMLKTDMVPVALDQAYQRRQKDSEGEFYRKIAGQGPRKNFQYTTQGFYIATPSGKLMLFNNNRDPQKMRRLMQQKLAEFRRNPESKTNVKTVERKTVDPRWNYTAPEGGLVVRVNAKVLGGYDEPGNKWEAIFQTAMSRDNLWVTKAEHQSLAQGTIPKTLQQRIARYHLVDNTRGEPPMWRPEEIRELEMSVKENEITGTVKLQTKRGDRGYDASFRGRLEVKNGKVIRLDLVAKGDFWGEGRYTRRAPKGKFPFAVAFRIADGKDIADTVRPQGSRGWIQGYLK